MQIREGAAIALRALWAHKLRTGLTLLGNIVGVMSVIAVVSLIAGINAYVREEIADEGSNIVTVRWRNELAALSDFDAYLATKRNPRLTLADHAFLARWLPARHRVAARSSAGATVQARGRELDGVRIEGWTGNHADVANLDIAFGRLFSAPEVDGNRPVCVLGADLVEKLFDDRPAAADQVRIGGRHLRVIGGLAERAGAPGASPNRRLLMPITVFQKIFGARRSVTIPVRVATVEETPAVIEMITEAMRVRHRLLPDEPDDFAVMTSATLISLWENISRSIFSALIFLVSISLVVGGIVIMNTMLVSVTERTREIGVRKAIGARRRDLTWQFLIEAVTLSVTGGVIGIALGFLVAALVGRFSPLPYAIELWSVFLGLAVTVAVGLFFGLYPARRAAGLDPVEALRREG